MEKGDIEGVDSRHKCTILTESCNRDNVILANRSMKRNTSIIYGFLLPRKSIEINKAS